MQMLFGVLALLVVFSGAIAAKIGLDIVVQLFQNSG